MSSFKAFHHESSPEKDPVCRALRIGGGRWVRRAPPKWFSLEQQLDYRCLKGTRVCAEGIGRTLQMSSQEVRFATQHMFSLGQKIQLAIRWPALLNNTCKLKLDVLGSVTDSQPGVAAVKIERYDFRVTGLRSDS